jgi:hypothetical protein
MGKSFRNITLCAVGSLGEITDKIPNWVKANGGTFSKGLNDAVTHLVTTKEAFKQNGNISTSISRS